MRTILRGVLSAVVVGSIVSCLEQPAPQLREPQVVSSTQVPEATAVVLTAQFDHIQNIADAGFRLWAAEGTMLSKTTVPLGNTISTRFDGLEPETEYSYQVYFGNGLKENCTEAKTFRTLQSPEAPPEDPPVNPGENPGDNSGTDPVDPDDPVDNTKFDPTLLAYLLDNYDTDGDGMMSRKELESITELVISGLVLDSLDGLETLTELRSLGTGDNVLARIDVTANKKLEFLAAGNDRYLEEIILDNPVLNQTYFIGSPALHHLDLSNCPQMGTCEWWGIALEEIDFSHNRDLTILRIGGTRLKELDLSSNRKLSILNSVNNPDLEVVWLWSGIKMESLEVDEHTEIRYK